MANREHGVLPQAHAVAPLISQATIPLRPITFSCPSTPTPLTTTSVYADIAWDVVFAAPSILFELHEHHPSQNSSDRHGGHHRVLRLLSAALPHGAGRCAAFGATTAIQARRSTAPRHGSLPHRQHLRRIAASDLSC